MIQLGQEELVLVGCPLGLLAWQSEYLPDRSVVIIETPDGIRNHDFERVVRQSPVVGRLIAAEYRTDFDLDDLLTREPGLANATLVVPGREYAVGAAARLADRLGLPGAGLPAGDIFRDKYQMRQLAAANGIANPVHRLVRSPAEAEKFFAEVGGRCVLKPTNRQGSSGVQFIDAHTQIAECWAHTAEPDTTDPGTPTGVLLEQALTGPEFSVELLVSAGEVIFRNVTAKRLVPGRFPVELGHTVPAPIPAELRTTLLASAEALAAAARFGSGVLHSEWIVQAGVPTLVECAARLPGDSIGTLISMAYEFRFIETFLRVLRGDQLRLPTEPAGAAAVQFLTAPPGRVVAVAGVKQASRSPGVVDAQVTVEPDAQIRAVTASTDRIGQIMALGDTPAEAETNARTAANAIQVTVA
ncbi:ATP-grasp domain-containing protein [Micromonospora sp. NPDC003197]